MKHKKNKVFIAKSMDGYIAGINGEIDWLEMVPNPDQNGMGYFKFMEGIDALVMGRASFETICGFDVEWPYKVPVYVISRTITEVPEKYRDKAEVIEGDVYEVLEIIHDRGHTQLYIDGGQTIQSFLREDLIDEMIITTLPILLGAGIPLFGTHSNRLEFEHQESHVFLNQLVQNHYVRKRK